MAGVNFMRGVIAAGVAATAMDKGYLPKPNCGKCLETFLWGVDIKEPELRNEAFVFIKPHANTSYVRELVKRRLQKAGINVTSEGEISGEAIDEHKYIDQHYYAIASKATILKPHQLNVPEEKFQKAFGLSWNDALSKGTVLNAMDACAKLGVDATQLDKLWAEAKNQGKLVKFGGGFYCGKIDTVPGQEPLYVFNGFFMKMRSKFTEKGTSIHYYTVDFDPHRTNWSNFRGSVLGPTDPETAPEGSLRRDIYDNWHNLGLYAPPNVGDNAVHASASPFEALAEKVNWLGTPLSRDRFGKALLDSGLSRSTIHAWSVDPQVPTGNGSEKKSLFDQLEDLDVKPCLDKAVKLAKN